MESREVVVAVVIVNYKTADLTVACLQSLHDERSGTVPFRVVLVEGCSGDGPQLRRVIDARGWSAWVTLLMADKNGGFAFGNNIGIREAMAWACPPEYVMLLNPDTEVRAGAIDALVSFMHERPQAGIAGSSFEGPDGDPWPIAFRFPSIVSELDRGLRLGWLSRVLRSRVVPMSMSDRCEPVDWVSGASMLVRRSMLDQIGPMDDGFFLYYEEVDLCRRARRAGWQCWYVPQSRVMHISGQSTGVSSKGVKRRPMPAYWFESRRRYFVKHHGVWGARFADATYCFGLAVYKLRRRLFGLPDPDPPSLLRDAIRHSTLFQTRKQILQTLRGTT